MSCSSGVVTYFIVLLLRVHSGESADFVVAADSAFGFRTWLLGLDEFFWCVPKRGQESALAVSCLGQPLRRQLERSEAELGGLLWVRGGGRGHLGGGVGTGVVDRGGFRERQASLSWRPRGGVLWVLVKMT